MADGMAVAGRRAGAAVAVACTAYMSKSPSMSGRYSVLLAMHSLQPASPPAVSYRYFHDRSSRAGRCPPRGDRVGLVMTGTADSGTGASLKFG